jgi:putative phosphoribosyl transferase
VIEVIRSNVEIGHGNVRLPGELTVPRGCRGAVVFAHGSGSSRLSPRNAEVATRFNHGGLATLLFDLLTPNESTQRSNVFDIGLLTDRLVAAVGQMQHEAKIQGSPIGLFGASTGAAAAIDAAALVGEQVRAVVGRGGRPDLASHLEEVQAPILLVVGGNDTEVLDLNREAAQRIASEHELEVVEGATHLFEEPGTLRQVADLARAWFTRWFAAGEGTP